MGNCSASSRLGYEELRDSIPGSLVADQDFDLFYSLCKTETVGALSMALHPSKTQLFYVVISGQVVAHLNSPKVPNVCATTFFAGDMIHFFNSPIHPVTNLDHNCLKNGSIMLSLQFKGYTEKMGRVIGMDRAGWDTFLQTRAEHKKPLLTLLSISIADFRSSSKEFADMTTKQAQMLGPLLKIRMGDKGGVLCQPLRQNRGVGKRFHVLLVFLCTILIALCLPCSRECSQKLYFRWICSCSPHRSGPVRAVHTKHRPHRRAPTQRQPQQLK